VICACVVHGFVGSLGSVMVTSVGVSFTHCNV